MSESEINQKNIIAEKEEIEIENNKKLNEKINRIKSDRGQNQILNKIKKNMEMRRNLEKIFIEIEQKNIEYENKMNEKPTNKTKDTFNLVQKKLEKKYNLPKLQTKTLESLF